ncbi:dihydroorotate dehydrogenase 2 isoform X1 [Rhipicephalus microplus]|uniref:dihydroorotate dehydrogenase 2 isoform X1 n=1 Tax=Rhipicephalus microplus TaxID=6941 RepID=UPI003F6B581A
MSRFTHKIKSMAAVVAGASVSFVGVATVCGQADFYQRFLMPAVHAVLDPEQAHRLAVQVARLRLLRKQRKPDQDVLRTELFGLHFPNAVGLAAGFDKHGEGVPGAHDWGFGFVEVGSVTPLPQPGNRRPRVFRLTEDLAVVNRYGFNSVGHQKAWSFLNDSRSAWHGLVGVNLGRNKESADVHADYVAGVHRFADLADYLVVNVSSPNTPGLRTLQRRHQLKDLLLKVLEARDSQARRLPVLVKIAPDLSDEEKADIAAVVTETKVDGLVVCNTTVSRPSSLHSKHRTEPGGLSGRPLRDLSTQTISDLYRLTKGKMDMREFKMLLELTTENKENEDICALGSLLLDIKETCIAVKQFDISTSTKTTCFFGQVVLYIHCRDMRQAQK